jgi:hypothetical protein
VYQGGVTRQHCELVIPRVFFMTERESFVAAA